LWSFTRSYNLEYGCYIPKKCGIKDEEMKEYPKKFITGRLKKISRRGRLNDASIDLQPSYICGPCHGSGR
jgi:hypothetical protein